MYLYNDKVKHASLNNLQIILGNVRSSSTFQHLIPCNFIMINLSLYIFTRGGGLIYKQWHNMSTRGTTQIQIRALNNTKTIAILKRSIVTRSQFHAAPNFPFLISWIFFYGISIVIHITKIWMFKVKKQARYRDDNLCCVQVNKAPVFNLFSSNLMYYKPLDYN